ncbi:MAG: hypothetical protein QOH48_2143 [Actinomycetota bacterium]|jgi:hypothetical protein|nr:hypothetical protein [Actinomycetota bacterium]
MRNPVSGLHNSGGFRLIGQRRFDAGNDLNLRGIYLTGLAALVGAEGLVIPLCSCVDPGHRSSGSSFLPSLPLGGVVHRRMPRRLRLIGAGQPSGLSWHFSRCSP